MAFESSSEYFFASFAEVGAALRLLQDVFGSRLHRRIVLALGLEEDVAGAHLLGAGELRRMLSL